MPNGVDLALLHPPKRPHLFGYEFAVLHEEFIQIIGVEVTSLVGRMLKQTKADSSVRRMVRMVGGPLRRISSYTICRPTGPPQKSRWSPSVVVTSNRLLDIG